MKIGKLTIKFHSPVTFKFEGRYMREVKKALKEENTILAIKLYRDGTGKPLRECRDYVVEVLKPKYHKASKSDLAGMFAEVGAQAFNNQ